MSYEVVTEDGSQGQFASNGGYADLIAAAKSNAVLTAFFDAGETKEVNAVVTQLRALSGAADVRSTAVGLADMIEGAEEALITHGMTGTAGFEDEENFHKFDPDAHVAGNAAVEIVGEVIKLDQTRHLVFGMFSIVEIAGRPVQDTQGDMISPETLEDCAYHFVLNARTGGHMHERDDEGEVTGIGRLVESCMFTKEKQAAIEKCLQDQGISAVCSLGCTAWWGGFYVDDPVVWSKVTTGELRAFSIGGKGKRA